MGVRREQVETVTRDRGGGVVGCRGSLRRSYTLVVPVVKTHGIYFSSFLFGMKNLAATETESKKERVGRFFPRVLMTTLRMKF